MIGNSLIAVTFRLKVMCLPGVIARRAAAFHALRHTRCTLNRLVQITQIVFLPQEGKWKGGSAGFAIPEITG
jgi:hypothetical protein